MRRFVWLSIPILVLAASTTLAQPLGGEAKKHLDRGITLYSAGSFDEAVAEFQAGLKIVEHPDLFYALAQAQRKRGDCASAIPGYRRFLAANPPVEEAKRAEANLKRCEEIVASQPPPPVAPEHPPAPEASATAPAVPAPTPTATPSATSSVDPAAGAPPAKSDPPDSSSGGGLRLVGLGVMATGGLLLGVGGYFAARAASDWGAVNDAAAAHKPWSGDLQRRYDAAGSAETNATVLFVAGGVAAVTGGLLYYFGWRSPSGRGAAAGPGRPAAAFVPAARGGRMVVRCEF